MKQINRKLFALLLGTVFTFSVCANEQDALDRQGKFMAVYLLHFSNFVEWPESSFNEKNNFNICINGITEINKHINDIEGDDVKGRKIKIIKNITNEEAKNCQILFISRIDYDSKNIKQILLDGNTLLVSDMEGFISDGGMIEYFVRDNKLRVAINIGSAKKNGLKISSKLLRIAKIVGADK